MQWIIGLSFAALMVTAAISDARLYRIPNWISAAVLVLYPLSLLVGAQGAQIAPHLMTGAAALGGGFILFCCGWIGGGDVKLWGAVALWLGPDLILPHLVLVAVLGGVLGCMLLVKRAVVARKGGGALVVAPLLRGKVPYGIPIALGAVILLPHMSFLAG